jgi:hypothetical protein
MPIVLPVGGTALAVQVAGLLQFPAFAVVQDCPLEKVAVKNAINNKQVHIKLPLRYVRAIIMALSLSLMICS